MDVKKSGNSSKNDKRRSQNVLEALKDIGGATAASARQDLLKGTSEDIFKQLLGRYPTPQRKVSGELSPGETLEMDKAYSGEQQRATQERKQLTFLNKLKDEETRMVEREKGELKLQLNALQQELLKLMEVTQDIAQETQVAAMSAPIEPGVYHIRYYEKLLEFIKSFRKQIGGAAMWMAESNKRAQKKNYWSKYKKSGSKFLLSADHYLTRSAG